MRQTIELLKKQSIQAGLTSAHMVSMGKQVNGKGGSERSPSKKSLNGSHETGLHNGNGHDLLQRHHSTDSICSINSLSSNCSTQDKKKKKGWVSWKLQTKKISKRFEKHLKFSRKLSKFKKALRILKKASKFNIFFFFFQLRSSFTKAFSRNAKISKTTRQMSLNGSLSDSKSSLPPLTPQRLPPKAPSVQALPDYGKPPISPTKSPMKHVMLIENGNFIFFISLFYFSSFPLRSKTHR